MLRSGFLCIMLRSRVSQITELGVFMCDVFSCMNNDDGLRTEQETRHDQVHGKCASGLFSQQCHG